MEFEYTDTFYVSEKDLERMCNMVKSGYTPLNALCDISEEWEDEDFYRVGLVEEQIIAEIEKRLQN